MYKEKLSLYTPNTITSHDTCKGLRKSCGMVNVIKYRGLTSGSGLFSGFAGSSATYLSYTVNKHKSMIVNTLFVTNPFLIITNTTNENTCSKKGCTRCVNQARKVLRVYPTN